MVEENRVCFIELPETKSRSVSPLSPSPCRERNIGFFHSLSRRFGRTSHDELIYNGEDDSRSSSTDSCSSTTVHLRSSRKDENNSNLELSCASSDTSSSADETEKTSMSTGHLHRRSTSSIRRALHNLSISSRSLSCSSSSTKSKEPKQKKTKKQPQRILRQPVAYTYLKGMSGLPTQRVPRTAVCCNLAQR